MSELATQHEGDKGQRAKGHGSAEWLKACKNEGGKPLDDIGNQRQDKTWHGGRWVRQPCARRRMGRTAWC